MNSQEVNKLNTQLLSWSFIFGRCPSVDVMNSAATAYQFRTKSHVVVPYNAPQQKQRTEADTKLILCAYMSPLLFVRKYTLAMLAEVN